MELSRDTQITDHRYDGDVGWRWHFFGQSMPWVSARALSIVNINFTVRFGPITCLLPFDWNDLDLMLPLESGGLRRPARLTALGTAADD